MISSYLIQAKGKWAHFKRTLANTTCLTYPFPTRTSIIGLMGGIMGISPDNLEYLNKLEIAVIPKSKTQYIDLYQNFFKEMGKNQPVKVQYLKNPEFDIIIKGDQELLEKIDLAIKQPFFLPYFGCRSCFVNLSGKFIDIIPIQEKKTFIHSIVNLSDINQIFIAPNCSYVIIEDVPYILKNDRTIYTTSLLQPINEIEINTSSNIYQYKDYRFIFLPTEIKKESFPNIVHTTSKTENRFQEELENTKKDLFKDSLLSHPDKTLQNHHREVDYRIIRLTKGMDKQTQEILRICAKTHDFGKALGEFQKYICGEKIDNKKLKNHGDISAIQTYLSVDKYLKCPKSKKRLLRVLAFLVVRQLHRGWPKRIPGLMDPFDKDNVRIQTDDIKYDRFSREKFIKIESKDIDNIYNDVEKDLKFLKDQLDGFDSKTKNKEKIIKTIYFPFRLWLSMMIQADQYGLRVD